MADEPMSLLARLKRHHIYRVASIYALAGWVVIQLANGLFPNFGLMRSSVRIVIAFVALGFPLVMVLAWMFIKPADPEKITRWQHRRWRLGTLLTIAVITFVSISGIYIWKVNSEYSGSSTASSTASETTAFNPPVNSIAVLPFQNLNNDPSRLYFSDGITQELTNALSQITGLRVIAWQSVAGFRDSTLPANTIGKQLNVAYMLIGSILRQDDKLRVYVELVNTVSGYQVWSNKYDRSLKDVFTVQDEISKAIAGSLQIELKGKQVVVTTATTSTEAHDAYLKGMQVYNARTTANLYKAIKYFKQAIKLDPNYAQAYAQLGGVYTTLPENTSMTDQQATAKALPMVQKALALDPNLAQAHAVLAGIYITEHKIDAAKAELLTALALDPNNALAHTAYGYLLPLKEALAQFQQTAELNPESWAAQMNLATTYAQLGRNSEAIKAYQAAQKLSPDDIQAPLEIAFLSHRLSNNAEAVRVLTETKTSNQDDANILAATRECYAAVLDPGLRSQALINLDLLAGRTSGFNLYYLATAYIVLGENVKAIQLIQRFCGNTSDSCNDIATDTHYDSLHTDKQFQTLVARYGLKN